MAGFNYAPPAGASTAFNFAPPSAAPQQPSLIDQTVDFAKNVAGGIKTVAGDAYKALTAPVAPVPTVPFQAPPSIGGDIAQTALNSYANTLIEAKNRMNTLSSTVADQHATGLQKGLAAGEAGIGALQAFFAPISAAATGAERIPVLGGVAHAINNVFSMVGTVGADTLEGAVQSIPYVSQETKDKITPLAREIGALGLQIVAGKGGGDVFAALTKKSNDFIDSLNSGIKSVSEIKQPTVTNESPNASNVPIENLSRSDIQMGPKPRGLPVAESSPVPELGKIPGMTYEPVANGGFNFEPPTTIEPAQSTSLPMESTQTTPTGRSTQALKPIEGTGDLKTRGVSSSLEAAAIQRGLTESFGALPEFRGVDFNKIAADIQEHIAKDPETTMQIAMGEKAAPKGSIPEMYLNVLSKEAAARGDASTIYKLATQSKLTAGATTMGQRIAALGFQKEATDPVSAVKEVQDARLADLKARGIDKAKEAAKDESTFRSQVKEARSPKQTWSDFAKQIVCNI